MIKKIHLIAVVVIGIMIGMALGIAVTNTVADPGYTPIEIVVPNEGATIHKNAPLTIVTERLNDVCCSGPAKITVYIETMGAGGEIIASGSVLVNLAQHP